MLSVQVQRGEVKFECVKMQQRREKTNRSNAYCREMEGMSKLLRTVKQNVKSLAILKARQKEMFGCVFSSMVLWEVHKPGRTGHSSVSAFSVNYHDKSICNGVLFCYSNSWALEYLQVTLARSCVVISDS